MPFFLSVCLIIKNLRNTILKKINCITQNFILPECKRGDLNIHQVNLVIALNIKRYIFRIVPKKTNIYFIKA
jgi:hypothetical protein